MSAVLLDTHAVIWFMNGDRMEPASLAEIERAQSSGGLYVSPITAWEAALAFRKRSGRPDLGGQNSADWFRAVLKVPGVKLARPGQRIALEAARVPETYERRDPGDCFLIATARVKRIPIVTRDRGINMLAARLPGYLRTIPC